MCEINDLLWFARLYFYPQMDGIEIASLQVNSTHLIFLYPDPLLEKQKSIHLLSTYEGG